MEDEIRDESGRLVEVVGPRSVTAPPIFPATRRTIFVVLRWPDNDNKDNPMTVHGPFSNFTSARDWDMLRTDHDEAAYIILEVEPA